jgi:hypothetical protein
MTPDTSSSLPAAFEQAQSPDGLRKVIHSALVLRALGGSTSHLVEAIAYGAGEQGIAEADLGQIIETERQKVYPV